MPPTPIHRITGSWSRPAIVYRMTVRGRTPAHVAGARGLAGDEVIPPIKRSFAESRHNPQAEDIAGLLDPAGNQQIRVPVLRVRTRFVQKCTLRGRAEPSRYECTP